MRLRHAWLALVFVLGALSPALLPGALAATSSKTSAHHGARARCKVRHGSHSRRSRRCRRALKKKAAAAPAAPVTPGAAGGGSSTPSGTPGTSTGPSTTTGTETTTTPAPPPSIPRVQVTAVEYSFTLSRTTVPAGKVIFEFVNHGMDEHNLNIGQSEQPLAGSIGNTVSGGVVDRTVEVRPGSYTLFCSLPEHAKKGMKATLVVE